MTLWHSIILGIVQGLTEFLPISSSAHLVLTPYLLNWQIPPTQTFVFDVLVQMGTLVAVVVYFWRDLWRVLRAALTGLARRRPFAEADARLGWYIVLATVPAGLLGLGIKDRVEAAFNSPVATGSFLFVTAILLVLAELISSRSRAFEQINWKDALVIGLAQAIAVFPGVSRSGATITGGMLGNLDRPAAARFSFLMSVPIMLAAGILAITDLIRVPDLSSFLPVVVVGTLVAAVVGYLSIKWLLRFLAQRSLYIFAIYCALLGGITLLVSNAR